MAVEERADDPAVDDAGERLVLGVQPRQRLQAASDAVALQVEAILRRWTYNEILCCEA